MARATDRPRGDTSDGAGEYATDVRLWRDAVESGPTSPRWDDLLDLMVKFAYQRLHPALRLGWISGACRDHFGHPIVAVPYDWAHEDREDLVQDTIVAALTQMIKDIEVNKGWDQSRGTTLGSYFFTLCIGTFPNCLNSWRIRHRQAIHQGIESLEMPVPVSEEPDRIAVARQSVEVISRASWLPIRQRQALMGRAYGLSYDEIADQLGTTARAIEGLIRRAKAEIARMEVT